jgi:ribosomal protein S18 acetylase RimI-like enzyme
MVEITQYQPEHFHGVERLWREAFPDDPPWNAAALAVPAKEAVQPELFLLALEAGEVVGSIMAGYDGHRGWLYAAAVLRSHRGAGVGAQLVAEAERRLQQMGCAKVNLQVRADNAAVVGFYRRLGYETEARVSMGKRLGPTDSRR